MTTAATKARPKDRPTKRANIVEAMDGIFKPWFPGDTWGGWKAVMKAMDALPMTAEEIEFFKSVAGGREPPAKRVSELVGACARRSGKDSVASLTAAQSAALFDGQDKLRPGERAQVLCLACDRDQAQIILNYIKSYFDTIPALRAMVERETRYGFELNNSVDIQVATNSFRAVRGRPILLAILDEAAFYNSETSASPDTELYAALKPGLATLPGSRIIIISSPYRRAGLLWDRYQKYFGKDDDNTLVIQAAVRQLNPTISEELVAAAFEEDPAAAAAEWGGQFRSDIEAFLSREAIEAVTSVGVIERGHISGQKYYAYTDPSGGSADSMTLAIAHMEHRNSEKVVVLDAVRERRPPFSPEGVVDEFCQLLKLYGVTSVRGDRYAGEWPRERFRVHGIQYDLSDKTTSDTYRDFLPIINSKQVDLLDHKRLFTQLVNLERRTSRGGRDTIGHPPGQHDDIATSVAGVVVATRAASNVTRARMLHVNIFGR
jgi:hypothetical protein